MRYFMPEQKPVKKRVWLVTDIYEWAESILTAIITIIFIFAFAARVTSVEGVSMEPTLSDKDRMLVTNFFYAPNRGDIVVVYTNGLRNEKGTMGKPIIKRVIGIAGDKIDFNTDEGTVSVNGELLEISEENGFLYENGHLISSKTDSSYDQPIHVEVPDGYIFVMGDNRVNSTDSRFNSVGMVDVDYVAGRAFFRISPFSGFGFVK